MSDTLANRSRTIIADVFNVPLEQVTSNATCDMIKNWDSANIINLMLALEAEFAIEIDVDEATRLTSIESILKILHGKGLT
jgi:acyl carrier protein